jgi:hypothetical protein
MSREHPSGKSRTIETIVADLSFACLGTTLPLAGEVIMAGRDN